jgi:YHS domain-containing protein
LLPYPSVILMVVSRNAPSVITMRDPVCNMSVDPDKPGAKETFNGKTYMFCCNKCKATFDKNRDKFTDKE